MVPGLPLQDGAHTSVLTTQPLAALSLRILHFALRLPDAYFMPGQFPALVSAGST